MNRNRYNHSICILGDKIFSICGIDQTKTHLSCIEKISLKEKGACWQLITLDAVSPRYKSACCAISPTKIAIMGGNKNQDFGDIIIYDDHTEKA